MITCIRREYLGGSEDISFDEFVRSVIQDDLVAVEIAERMLETYDEPYLDNVSEPEYMERYSIIDKVLFEDGIERYKEVYL